MLLRDDPGEPDEYPCILCVPSEIRRKLEDKAIKMPQTQRLKGHRSYDFYCGGLGWVYVVSSHIRENLGANKVVTPDGKLPILFDWRFERRRSSN